jgi:uncharacterized protein (DUF1015 family)
MASIRPFRGLRYDLDRAGPASTLMAPPYDVVDGSARRELAARSEYNSIHFILPEGDGEERYARASARFRSIAGAAMVRDPTPGYYVYHQTFQALGTTYTRKGFVGLIELTPFGAGPVLPHERTLAGPKQDRLDLMRACEAHLELVFGMFPDPSRGWENCLGRVGRPVLETEFGGVHHQLWRVHEPASVGALTEYLADSKIYIADGHHRYETMCTFREELQSRGHANSAYGMIYLANLDDPGLVVLPTHRLVHGLPDFELSKVLSTIEPWFDVVRQPLPDDVASLHLELRTAGGDRATFGLSIPGSGELVLLTLRASFDPVQAGLEALPPVLQQLDVVLLHELVLERALGISKAAQEAKTNLGYEKSSERALALCNNGAPSVQLVCLMNATPVADVRAVCDSGHVMPQKSTFFYPKIPNGLVFHDLQADDR